MVGGDGAGGWLDEVASWVGVGHVGSLGGGIFEAHSLASGQRSVERSWLSLQAFLSWQMSLMKNSHGVLLRT